MAGLIWGIFVPTIIGTGEVAMEGMMQQLALGFSRAPKTLKH